MIQRPQLAITLQTVGSVFRAAVCFCVCACVGSLGCRSCEKVESELRNRENEVHDLRDELHRAESLNESLQNELQSLRPTVPPVVLPSPVVTPGVVSPPAVGPPVVPAPVSGARPASGLTVPVKEIVLGRQTGGYDDDGHPGDEALQIVVEPHDFDGHAVKAPGSLLVSTVEITPEGLKKPLATWDIAADQVRRSWKNGLFTTGYYIVLPWKTWPNYEKLRVIVQFAAADGRLFEADRDITIRLCPPDYRLPPTKEEKGPEFMLPPPHPVAPAPSVSNLQPVAAWQKASNAPLFDAVHLLPPEEIPPKTVILYPGP